MPKPTDNSSPELMTTAEVAEFLRTPERTLHQWTYKRTGPPSMKVGSRRLYSRHDLLVWLDSRKVSA